MLGHRWPQPSCCPCRRWKESEDGEEVVRHQSRESLSQQQRYIHRNSCQRACTGAQLLHYKHMQPSSNSKCIHYLMFSSLSVKNMAESASWIQDDVLLCIAVFIPNFLLMCQFHNLTIYLWICVGIKCRCYSDSLRKHSTSRYWGFEKQQTNNVPSGLISRYVKNRSSYRLKSPTIKLARTLQKGWQRMTFNTWSSSLDLPLQPHNWVSG